MKKYNSIARLTADLIMVLSIAWAPLSAVILFSIIFAWLFAPYYEIILWGLAFDALYGFHSIYGILAALAIFIMIEVLKKKTRI